MSKLKELEKRLKGEPENLGLRVMVAGALIEAGRRSDAVDLYHSVAIAYRDQGRPQQAIVVCRSLLELAPDDLACQALLAALTAVREEAPAASRLPPQLPPAADDDDDDERRGGRDVRDEAEEVSEVELSTSDAIEELEGLAGVDDEARRRRRSSFDVTPLPAPMPYHEADPSSLSRPKLRREDLPSSLRLEHAALVDVPFLEIEGIANAARAISASLLAASPPDSPDAPESLDAPDSRDARDARVGDDVPSREETIDADDVVDVTEAEDGFGSPRRARLDPHAALEHLGTLRPTVPLGRPARPPADSETGDDELTLPPKLDAIPNASGVDDEKTRPRGRPPGLPPVGVDLSDPRSRPTASAAPERKASERSRSSRLSRPLAAEVRSLADRASRSSHSSQSIDLPEPVTEPRNLADLAPSTRISRPLVSESRSLPDRAALSVDPPDPVTEPRNLADRVHRTGAATAAGSREIPRMKPPSIAPATQATGPLASVLFAPVPPAQRAVMLQRFRRRLAGIGTTVIRRGETGHGLILVVHGRLDVHAEGADGSRVSLDAIGPGDHVGEIGLVSRTPAAAYVVAAVDSELLVLAAPDFYELAGELPALWKALSAAAERRTRDHAQLLQT